MVSLSSTILEGVRSLNGHDLDLYDWSRSQLNTPIESLYVTPYLMAAVIFSKSVFISKIFAVEVCMAVTLTFGTGEGEM